MKASLRCFLSLATLAGAGLAHAEYPIDAHTVALWRFDGRDSLSFPDAGPGSLDLHGDSALALEASPEDSALVLDGRAGLMLQDSTRISVGRTGMLTYQARIWLDAYPSASNHNRFGFLMGKYEGMGLFIRSDGRLSVNNQKGDGTSWMWYAPVTARGAVPLKRWVEVAAACDQAAAECYCYVDGKAQATYTYMVGESYNPPPVFAGDRFRSAASPLTVGYNARDGQRFPGRIEAIKISDTLVYAPGPRAVTTPLPEVPASGPIASWDFDEGTGDTLRDRTGHGHDGIVHGARWVDGMRGKALEFSGREWVEVPGDSATHVKSFTFSVWLKQSGNGFRVPILEFHEPNAMVGVHLWANTSGWGNDLPGAFYANLRPQDASRSQPSSVRERNLLNTGAGSAQGGRWNHVVLVLDHAALKARIHVNGKLAASRALDPFQPRTTGSLFLGMRRPGSLDGDADVGLVGTLDQADLYGRALTEAEILALYGNPPVDPRGIHLGIKTHHAKAGDTLWVPVYISSTGRDSLASLEFKLEHDTSVAELLDVKVDTGLAAGWQVQDWNRLAKGTVPIALAGTRRLVGPQEGELLRLAFRVLPGLREGASTQLTLRDPLADEGRVQSLSVAAGRIFVLPAGIVHGDVTGDGEVELLDAQTILRHVVGELALPSSEFPAFTVAVADVSGNGGITAYDAALVVQFALGILGEFPVQVKSLAKRAAAGRLLVSAATHVEGDVWRYRIRAEGLAGLMGGELSFEAPGGVTSIVRVSPLVAGMRTTYRFDPVARRLDIALAGNRRLEASGSAVDFLEVEAAYPPTSSARGLILRGASLNEGSLIVEGAGPATSIGERPVASRAGLRLSWDGAGLRFEAPGHSLSAAEILDIRGRRVAMRRYDSPVAAGYLSRSALPAGLLVLRAIGKDGTWTQILPSLAP